LLWTYIFHLFLFAKAFGKGFLIRAEARPGPLAPNYIIYGKLFKSIV